MRVPRIHGVIDRRILINYRVDPCVLGRVLPEPFRPRLVRGNGVAGVCLIRLRDLRPRFAPRLLGVRSENAAHRIAVQWDHNGELREGVYIPRRDTDSRLSALAGGRIFPGVHHHARFAVAEGDNRYCVRLDSDDGAVHLSVDARGADRLPSSSIFGSLDHVSRFFRDGAVGYSATNDQNRFDGVELACRNWRIHPLHVDYVESSWFDDPDVFPPDSIEFDSALLMCDIEHEWRAVDDLCASSAQPSLTDAVPAFGLES